MYGLGYEHSSFARGKESRDELLRKTIAMKLQFHNNLIAAHEAPSDKSQQQERLLLSYGMRRAIVSRSTFACQNCRKLKVRCNASEITPCRNCSLNGHECIIRPGPGYGNKAETNNTSSSMEKAGRAAYLGH